MSRIGDYTIGLWRYAFECLRRRGREPFQGKMNNKDKTFCDLCDQEVSIAKKDEGIWVCVTCEKEYPKDGTRI